MSDVLRTRGRSIRLYLADGSPTGILTAEIMNWTGHVLYAPRSRIADLLKREETVRTGVYLLVGSDIEQPSQTMVYVGESDNVGTRLSQHAKDPTKEFWEYACVVTSKDQNLTKSHVRYLEARLIEIINREGRVELANGTAPEFGLLPEADIDDMEYFLDQLQVLLPVLGLGFTRTTPRSSVQRDATTTSFEASNAQNGSDYAARQHTGRVRPTRAGGQSPEFQLSDRKFGINARATEIDGQMVVLAGSQARTEDQPSLASNVRALRQQLITTGKLTPEKEGVLKFLQDVAFSSPSAAAQAVMGTSRNGRADWIIPETHQTYAQWQEAQLPSALPSGED